MIEYIMCHVMDLDKERTTLTLAKLLGRQVETIAVGREMGLNAELSKTSGNL